MLENTNSIGVLAMAAGGVAGLAMLAGIAVSLWKARSLVHKEFFSYFLSPIAYAVLVVFLGVQGWLVAGTLDLLLASGPRGVEWPLQFWLSSPVFWLVFLAACPLLTMRTFAEEKASGTLEMLMTSPEDCRMSWRRRTWLRFTPPTWVFSWLARCSWRWGCA